MKSFDCIVVGGDQTDRPVMVVYAKRFLVFCKNRYHFGGSKTVFTEISSQEVTLHK